jgi:hypothetical protein
MDHIVILTMLKYSVVRDTLPKTKPLRHVRTFQDFCKFCIFPFVDIIAPEENPQQDHESFSDMMNNFNSIEARSI